MVLVMSNDTIQAFLVSCDKLNLIEGGMTPIHLMFVCVGDVCVDHWVGVPVAMDGWMCVCVCGVCACVCVCVCVRACVRAHVCMRTHMKSYRIIMRE